MKISNSKVSVVIDPEISGYCTQAPFNPPNNIYECVERLLSQMDDPIEKIVKPGNIVLIKPNLVKNFKNEYTVSSRLTNGSILRPIVDHVFNALKGSGKIIIADTPIETADFSKIIDQTGIGLMVNYLRDVKKYPIELIDLRQYQSIRKPGNRWETKHLLGDPEGYVPVNLGTKSEFDELDEIPQNYQTLSDHSIDHLDPLNSDTSLTNQYHHKDCHEYLIAKSVLNADVFISIAKLKTHKKAGVTLSLKNAIGIVPNKIYLPHYRPGIPPHGDSTDCIPKKSVLKKRKRRYLLNRILSKYFGDKISSLLARSKLMILYDKILPKASPNIEFGDWYGNDTIWRTILDLNKIIIYADNKGNVQDSPVRNYLSFIDGITGLEGDGPISGNPVETKILLGGYNPVTIDVVAARIMGFDAEKINLLKNCKSLKMSLGESEYSKAILIGANPKFNFKPPKGWKNHIELEK